MSEEKPVPNFTFKLKHTSRSSTPRVIFSLDGRPYIEVQDFDPFENIITVSLFAMEEVE